MTSERIPLDNGSIYVASPFPDGIARFRDELVESGRIVGSVWNTAIHIVRSGIDWVGWNAYHSNLRSSYVSALAGRPELRHGQWSTEAERKAAMWERVELIQSMQTRHYVPEEVPLPDLAEGDVTTPSILRKFAISRGLSDEALAQYFLKTFYSLRFTDFAEAYEPRTWSELKAAKIVVDWSEAPIAELIDELSMKELRTCFRALGLKAARTASECKAILTSELPREEDRIRSALADCRVWAGYSYVHAPDGVQWSDFQSLRQQVKGMSVALDDLFFDDIRKKYSADYVRLTGQ
ncbi:hypothetical protein [Hoeflea sp. IMCC20628]|uniref:hypothetical protein n=1 Tax=Hoeflea sp. IMCC20628 TaxID=1620421 RepID=UPI0012E0A0BD|nr:hypothetical protein [Hoeflea sp. IMCC20628]